MNFAQRIYLRLAHAFPHEFKLAYGAEVEQLGEDIVEEIAKRHGVGGLVRLIADIAIRVPVEYLNEMRGDMRYALRALIKSPGFALVGILSHGAWNGADDECVQLAMAVHLSRAAGCGERPTSGDAGEACLVLLRRTVPGAKGPFHRGRRISDRNPLQCHLSRQSECETRARLWPACISGLFFRARRPTAAWKRVEPGADQSGDAPLVVISDRFWRNRLNSSPNAVGQTLRLNGQPATIVGITPKNFNGALAINPSELFVPVAAPATLAPELANDVLHQRNAKDFLAMMSMAPGVTMESAEAALTRSPAVLTSKILPWWCARTKAGA